MGAAVDDPDCFTAHRGKVRGVLLRLVKDDFLAEDLTQEALLRATRAAGSMRGEAAPATWLTAIAINLARDHFRAVARAPLSATLDQAEDIPSAHRPEQDVLEAEMSECILEHIARLPERQRDAVLLHHFSGQGHREIASALDTSEGNARVILHRGLSALRTSLGGECILNFGDSIPCERR